MESNMPSPMQSEHQALYARISAAAEFPGRTGKSARLVARLIERHFAREDEFVVPALALLPALALDTAEAQMSDAIALAARVHDEMPSLLAAQRVIVSALEELIAAAESEGHEELVEFAEKMVLHEEVEQRLSYPTAVLIGKYLELRHKA
jgi:hypothetical protein